MAFVMAIGTIFGKPGFVPLFNVLVRFNWLRTDRIIDNPETAPFCPGIRCGCIDGRIGLFVERSKPGWLGAGVAGDRAGGAQLIRRVLYGLCHVLLARPAFDPRFRQAAT